MSLVRFEDQKGRIHFGLEREDNMVQIASGSFENGFAATGDVVPCARLLPPVEPINIFGIGLNYRRHAAETGAQVHEHPTVFMKPTSAVIGPGDAIKIPECCTRGAEVDYECELAIVMGRPVRNVSAKDALNYVYGYTCANDVSARRWQKHSGGGQWVRGKSFDTFCPLGPRIVPAVELGDPQELSISTILNGEVMQNSTTGDMIFSVAEIISFLSRDTTILPGTVILTGTPEGVGFVRKPPVFLADGDEVTIDIERVGILTNKVVAA